MLWLEDVRASVTALEKLSAALLWRRPLHRQEAEKPAVILFTSGSEGTPKAVVLSHRNLLANAMQAEARITVSPADKLLNVLPVFHSFGLTGGTILPLVSGVRLFLYPSPLHYKIIPEIARKITADGDVRHRHVPRRLCAHRQGRRFFQPALRRRRRRGRQGRDGGSGASASAPRSSRASA